MSTPTGPEDLLESLKAREFYPGPDWEADYGYQPDKAASQPAAPPAVAAEAAPAPESGADDADDAATARALELAEKLPALPPGTSAVTVERLHDGPEQHMITVERGNGGSPQVLQLTHGELQRLILMVTGRYDTSRLRAEFPDDISETEPHQDPELAWLSSPEARQYEGHWVALKAGTREFLGLADTSEDVQRWQQAGESILFVEPPGRHY